MNQFISKIKYYWDKRPFVWEEHTPVCVHDMYLPSKGNVLVLAPHPDDPESVAVTCRLFARAGCEIMYAIVSLSPSGVDDEYIRKSDNLQQISMKERKIEIRRMEQIRSAGMFGLAMNSMTFLGIDENELDSAENRTIVFDILEAKEPDIVIMPVGKDTNATHVWVYHIFRQYAQDLVFKKKKQILAMYNEDPKTTGIRSDMYVLFEEESAKWKSELLRAHDSQQQRNIMKRKMGFDERILEVNRLGYKRLIESAMFCNGPYEYAEVFELELFER